MSSRAAGSRKRLRPVQEPTPASPRTTSKGGFFSRSKNTAPLPKVAPVSYPSPPDTKADLPPSGLTSAPPSTSSFAQSSSAQHYAYRQEEPYRSQTPRDTPTYPNSALRKTASASATIPSSYHTPYREDEHRVPNTRALPNVPHPIPTPSRHPAPPLGREAYSSDIQPQSSYEDHFSQAYQEEGSFLEASYQPPPPVQSIRPQSPRGLPSYTARPPHPTGPSSSYEKAPRVLAAPAAVPASSYPDSSWAPQAAPTRPTSRPAPIYSTPTDFPITPPSPTNSPPRTSLLLQPASHSSQQSQHPDLPTYVYPRNATTQVTRPPLQITTSNGKAPSSLHPESQYAHPQNPRRYDSPSSYPSPPNSNPRHSPSPLRLNSPAASASSLPLDNRPMYQQHQMGSFESASFVTSQSHPVRSNNHQQPPIDLRINAAPSFVSSSSGSSQHSGDSHSAPQTPAPGDLAKPAFVFPGSRSTARPKVSAKTGTPRIKLRGKRSKSRNDKGSEGHPSPNTPTSGNGGSNPGSEYASSLNPSSPTSGDAPPISQRPVDSRSTGTPSTDDGPSSSRAQAVSLPGETPAPTPAPFVFPNSRSRAHPKTPPKPKIRSRRTLQNSDEPEMPAGRTKFMGISLGKKKKSVMPDPISPLTHTLSQIMDLSADGNSNRRSIQSQGSSEQGSSQGRQSTQGQQSSQDHRSYSSQDGYNHQDSSEVERQQQVRGIKSKIGSYPLDPYDSTLLDNDRHTGELLRRLNPTNSPSFHNYGNTPPSTVLDLGCGQGHWVLDAAIAWKGYGTRVTGFDMVDISKNVWSWAVKQGVTGNVKFIRGNFLKQRLPFNDDSFDLVRMSCLALCVTADRWEFVLQEVCRVLTIGGRLEFIDDHIFFPYGKAKLNSGMSAPGSPRVESIAPRLDITIPNSTFSTFSISDVNLSNPGLGDFDEEGEGADGDFYDLYGVEEEEEDGDFDDTATVGGHNSLASFDTFGNPRATPNSHGPFSGPSPVPRNSVSTHIWNQQAATSRDLEALFEHMLTQKYGIHVHPSEFILELMTHIFGHGRQVSTLHLTLAPSDASPPGSADGHDDEYGNQNRSRSRRLSRRNSTSFFSQSPGLILWPSTFLPMPQTELEIHASKHLRMLLSCKNVLSEYAVEATEDEEIDENSALEALWEYEGFLRQRFEPPPDADVPVTTNLDEYNSPVQEAQQDATPWSDAASFRGSITSVSSDGQDAMWEYQSELIDRFALPLDRPASRAASDSPGTQTPKTQAAEIPQPAATRGSPPSRVGYRRDTVASFSGSSIAPPYSRIELTHVRTFHVYEAIKMDGGVLGNAF